MKSLFIILLSCLHLSAKNPNIVFILADDLGYGDLGANNPESKIATPHLDKLAASGVRFTDAHAGGNYCVPSRYALLTGRFSVRAPTLDVNSGPIIGENLPTIATLLRDNGYQTAMVGKWHQGFVNQPKGSKTQFDYSQPLRGGPLDRGFDSYFGIHTSLDIPPYFYIRDRKPTQPPTDTVEARDSVSEGEGWNKIQGSFWRKGPIAPDYNHREVTPRFISEAVDVLATYSSGKKEKTLFLYLALPSPHTPWLPLDEFRGKSKVGMYGDFVMQVDAAIGQVLSSLDSTGLAEDTLVIFSSDNGPVWYDKDRTKFNHDSTGGLRGMKASSWEGAHRMPFVVRWPGKTKAGSSCAQTVTFSDFFATFAELLGSTSKTEDSVSFLPWILDTNKTAAPRPPIAHDERSIRDGAWKLILPHKKGTLGGGPSTNLPGQLYNLREDLAERNNLYEMHPELTQKMEAALKLILAK